VNAEARKQDVIVQSLLAAQHEQCIVKVFAAPSGPSRGNDVGWDTDLESDSPFVFGPGIQPPAVQQVDQGNGVENLIVLGRT